MSERCRMLGQQQQQQEVVMLHGGEKLTSPYLLHCLLLLVYFSSRYKLHGCAIFRNLLTFSLAMVLSNRVSQEHEHEKWILYMHVKDQEYMYMRMPSLFLCSQNSDDFGVLLSFFSIVTFSWTGSCPWGYWEPSFHRQASSINTPSPQWKPPAATESCCSPCASYHRWSTLCFPFYFVHHMWIGSFPNS